MAMITYASSGPPKVELILLSQPRPSLSLDSTRFGCRGRTEGHKGQGQRLGPGGENGGRADSE